MNFKSQRETNFPNDYLSEATSPWHTNRHRAPKARPLHPKGAATRAMATEIHTIAEACATRVKRVSPELTASAYLTSWLATMKWIDSQLKQRRGAALANFAKFTLTDVGSHVFVLNTQFARRYGISSPGVRREKLEPIEDLNYSRIAIQYSQTLTKDVVQTCLKHIIGEIGNALASGAPLGVDCGFGMLIARDRKVSFKFGAGSPASLEATVRTRNDSAGDATASKTVQFESPPQQPSPPQRAVPSQLPAGPIATKVAPPSKPSKGSSAKPADIPEEFKSKVLQEAYERHLAIRKDSEKKERHLEKYNQRRRRELDKQAKSVVKQKNESNRQLQEYLKQQISEKEKKLQLEKDDRDNTEDKVPLYPAEISSVSPQDIRKRRSEYKRFLDEQMQEKLQLKSAEREAELVQDWELLNDVEEDLALSRLQQVEIKKLKQKQLNDGWQQQIKDKTIKTTRR